MKLKRYPYRMCPTCRAKLKPIAYKAPDGIDTKALIFMCSGNCAEVWYLMPKSKRLLTPREFYQLTGKLLPVQAEKKL